MNGFGHYMRCFHPKKERAILLYSFLEKQYPRFPAKNLTHAYLSKTVYQKEADLKKVLNTMSDLYRWAKDYLIWQHQLKDENKKDLLWLEVLDTRNMDHEFNLKATLMDKKLAGKKVTDPEDYLNRLTFYHKVWAHPTTKRHTPDFKVLENCLSNLESFYEVSKLNYGAEILNRERMYKATDGLTTKSKKNLPPENFLLKVSKLQYKLVRYGEEEIYKELKKCYLYARKRLSSTSKSILLLHLINYSAHQIRSGKQTAYVPEAFQLYKWGLNDGILISHGIIPSHTFINIFTLSMDFGKLAWAKKFIDNYAPLVEPIAREQTELLVRAQLAFKLGNHNSAYFTKLQTVNFSDPLMAIRTKVLIMMNFYEARTQREMLLQFNTAFKYYLKRSKKVKGNILESSLNFANCYRQLVLNRVYPEEFKANVKSYTNIFLADWLLSKAVDLDGSGKWG